MYLHICWTNPLRPLFPSPSLLCLDIHGFSYCEHSTLRARQDQLIIPREDISIQIPKKGRQLIILTLLLTGLAGPLSDIYILSSEIGKWQSMTNKTGVRLISFRCIWVSLLCTFWARKASLLCSQPPTKGIFHYTHRLQRDNYYIAIELPFVNILCEF